MEITGSGAYRLAPFASPGYADEFEVVWLRFMPNNGSYLAKIMPVKQFMKLMGRHERVGVSFSLVGLLRNNHVVLPPTGVLYLQPDLGTAYRHPGDGTRIVEVMTSWVDQDAAPLPECARSKLSELDSRLRRPHQVRVLLGFEMEVMLLPLLGADRTAFGLQQPVPQQSWCSMTAVDEAALPAVEAIVRALRAANVEVQQFHTEACPGQWELVLPPAAPLQAADALVRARETIAFTARQHGFHATLHPRPVPEHAGTGAHVHVSANGPTATDGEVPKETAEHFFAGIMAHLPAIAAFALPLEASYERVKAGIWSGGIWVCWGTQNRETALRRITDGRFEIKTVCGTANPYLAMAAVLAAGLDGLERSLALTAGECAADPSTLSEVQRGALGIRTRLPRSVEESLGALQGDAVLSDKLGHRLTQLYIAVTREWNKHLQGMEPQERRRWLLANY